LLVETGFPVMKKQLLGGHMALIVISVDRSELPPHTDEDFKEWIKYEVGHTCEINLSNPLERRELRATVKEIG